MNQFTVKKSKVPIDLVMFDDVGDDEGLGLWQNVAGKFTFNVVSPHIESILKTDMDPIQKNFLGFQSSFHEDHILIPTVHSIQNDIVPIVFRIQHSSADPTHKLDYEEHALDYPWSYAKLVPRKSLSPNTEITFNYNK